MPIYWQVQKLAQSGVLLSDTAVGGWINSTCESLTAIYDALIEKIICPACKYMIADEPSIKVLDSDKSKGKKSHIGFV